jgi:hypothetical protein
LETAGFRRPFFVIQPCGEWQSPNHRVQRHEFCKVTDMLVGREPSVMKWDTSASFDPVILVFKDGNRRLIVRTVGEAANALMREWPSDDGEEFLAAVKACLDVMTGRADPDQLRGAIIRAADEAGVTALTVLH